MDSRKRISHKCEGRIKKSVSQVTVSHHSSLIVMPNSDQKEKICLTEVMLMDSHCIFLWRTEMVIKAKKIYYLDLCKIFLSSNVPGV